MNGDVEAGGNGQIGALISKNQTGTVIGRLGHTFAPLPGSPPGTPPFPIASGQLVLSTHDGHETITLNGAAGIVAASHVTARGVVATNVSAHDLRVEDKAGKDTIHIDGETGDILLLNADCAEEFPVSDPEAIEPGTVMIIEGEDRLRCSELAYDRRVAGVVSGAGDCKPGIVLGKRWTASDAVPSRLGSDLEFLPLAEARRCINAKPSVNRDGVCEPGWGQISIFDGPSARAVEIRDLTPAFRRGVPSVSRPAFGSARVRLAGGCDPSVGGGLGPGPSRAMVRVVNDASIPSGDSRRCIKRLANSP